MTTRCDVILPVLDEAASLPWLLGRMPEGYHAIVVDNGSTDGSAEVARELGAQVVAEPRRGFGAACFAGLTAATADVVAFMDADSSFDPWELDRVCLPVLAGTADLVLGSRVPVPGAWPWHARLANRVLAHRIRRSTGVPLTDLGPMRAARRSALIDLEMTDRGFGWPLEMVLKAARGGWRIEECTVTYRPRVGRSKVTGTVRGTYGAVSEMSRLMREAG
jgi:glycosyltransferase involved in cell wall biosynthesis